MTGEGFLVEFWAVTIAASILIYLILDGFDLGCGMLFGITSNEKFKRQILDSIAPVWDGNETWLVIAGASLYGAFPIVYAVVLPALYLPVGLMLVALILRGVTFEFRYKMKRGRQYLDLAFSLASVIISFVLGAAIGAVVQGITVSESHYSGGVFDWLTPYSVSCGLGLVAGHALLGAGWLVLKTTEQLQDWAYARLPILLLATLSLFCIIQVINPEGIGLVTPFLIVCALVYLGARKHIEWLPFAATCAIFVLVFAASLMLHWPFILPHTITLSEAAAPENSLAFLFYGAGLIAIPVTLVYTCTIFWVFRGKISTDTEFDYER